MSLSEELQLLEKEYMVVAMTTLAGLKQSKVPICFIQQQIMNIPHQTMKSKYQRLVDKRVAGLTKASMEQLFLSFSPYCDFLNPDMLELIAERFGDEISGAIIAMYLKRLRDFRRKTALCEMAGQWVAITLPGYVELSLHMGKAWEKRTLQDLEVFRSYPSRMQWFFKQVNKENMEVVFSVPKGVWLYEEDLANLRKHGALCVMEGQRCVVDLSKHTDDESALPITASQVS